MPRCNWVRPSVLELSWQLVNGEFLQVIDICHTLVWGLADKILSPGDGRVARWNLENLLTDFPDQ